MEWYLKAMNQYADFEGRARRKEYWMYILIYIVIIVSVNFLGIMISGFNSLSYNLLYFGVALIHLIPNLSVGVRRLHDVGKSGWWYLIVIIPLIGAIVLLVWFCTEGEAGPNKWGPNPKDENSGTVMNDMDNILDDIV